jgi:hypothetical protein
MSVIRIEWTLGESSGVQYFADNDKSIAFCTDLEKRKYAMAGTKPSEIWMNDPNARDRNLMKIRPKKTMEQLERIGNIKLTVKITHPKDGITK